MNENYEAVKDNFLISTDKEKLNVDGKIAPYLINGYHLERVFTDAKKGYVFTMLAKVK